MFHDIQEHQWISRSASLQSFERATAWRLKKAFEVVQQSADGRRSG